MGDITRRAALGATGGVALARPRLMRRTRPAGRRGPDWYALARHLRGRLLRPGDAGFTAASVPYNHRYAGIRAAGVALCAGADDVAAALRWARHYDVPFAARSGGHSYGGYSASRGLVISTAAMNSVRADPAGLTVTAGAGTRNRDLYTALAGTGIGVPSGRCPTVAISGLLLGGGFGFASRHLGLTCDHLLRTEVVTADGDILQVSPRSHPDLFWACQGGGGGNFGINTRYTLRAVPVGPVSVYKLEWSWPDARAALAGVRALMSAAPDALSCRVGIDLRGSRQEPQRGVSALGLYFGPGQELAGLLGPALAAAWPARQLIEDRSYPQAQAFLARNVPAGSFASKSRYLAAALPDDGIEQAVRWAEDWPGSTNPSGGGLTLFAWGGAIGRRDPGATAFVHRDAAYLADQEFTWTGRDSEHAVRAGLDWLGQGYQRLARFGNGQAYQNFIDPSLAGWRQAYYGANLARLRRVKYRYDPDNAFRFAQSIPEPAPA